MQDDKRHGLLAGYCHSNCYSVYTDMKYEYIQELIKQGSINCQIPTKASFLYRSNEVLFGYTALHIAAVDKDYKMFKLLMDNNADYTIKNGDNETPVHLIVKELYTNDKSSVELRKFFDLILSAHIKFKNYSNPSNKSGISHFHAACIRSQTKLVKLFLKNGASANEAISLKSKTFPGYTPIHFAAHFGCLSTAKILLNRGANANRKDAEGFTPLDLLIKRNMEIADWVNMGKSSCYDRLKREYEKNDKIIAMIMEKMQDSSIQLSNLHVACTLQNTSKLELELQNGDINLNQPVTENSLLWPGFTPLHFAAIFNKKSVQLLLDKGADFLIKNTKGITPFDLFLQRYEIDDLCAFVKSVPSWKNIKFFNSKISLSSALSAMKSEKTFGKFLKNLKNINMHIPWKSPIFPGFTLLHMAIALQERRQDIKDISKRGFYDADDGNTKVHFNCIKAKEEIYLQRIRMCLDSGADVTVANSHGSTPLHLAFELQKESAVDLLLERRKGKSDYSNKSNVHYLHIACASGNEAAVEELISSDSVNQAVTTAYKYRNFDISSGSTPLHIAVLNQNTEIVKLLVDSGADIYALDSNGLTPVHQMLVQGSKEKTVDPRWKDIASNLFASDRLKNFGTGFGLSHLHVASYTNNVTAIDKLVSNGGNIEATISFENSPYHRQLKIFKGFTPLHLALKLDCADAVVALLQRGANMVDMPYEILKKLYQVKYYYRRAPSFINELASREKNFGLTKLHVACAKLDVPRVRELLDEGADPNAQVHKDSPIYSSDTPLHFALLRRENNPMNDVREIIDLLLSRGANVTIAGFRGNTAIHRAAFNDYCTGGTFEFPEQLLLAHTDLSVNPTNSTGLSHFHIACRRNALAMVKGFLKHGVDVNRTIEFAAYLDPGHTALHIAASKKFGEIVELLLDHGADVDARNIFYRMPIHEAAIFHRGHQNLDEKVLLRLAKTEKGMHSTTIRGLTPLEILLYTKSPITDTFRLFLKDKNRVNLFNPIQGEGFLSTAIYFHTNVEQLLRNPFFAEVLNAPEANSPDEMGRTPVHNIVSFLKGSRSAPVNIYVKALEQLMKVGFDIDDQDVTGRTALHYAAQYQNVNGFTALLNVGADINISDNDGKTPMFLISQWIEEQDVHTESRKKILKLVLDRIYKMQNSGIYVNSVNISHGATLNKYWEKNDTTKKEWQDEKEKLTAEKIDSSELKLSSFLCENGAVASYSTRTASERQRIEDFFNTNVTRILKDYPHFGGLLMLQYRKAQARVALFKNARLVLGDSIDYILPEVCRDSILGYLSNEHLKTMLNVKPCDKITKNC